MTNVSTPVFGARDPDARGYFGRAIQSLVIEKR